MWTTGRVRWTANKCAHRGKETLSSSPSAQSSTRVRLSPCSGSRRPEGAASASRCRRRAGRGGIRRRRWHRWPRDPNCAASKLGEARHRCDRGHLGHLGDGSAGETERRTRSSNSCFQDQAESCIPSQRRLPSFARMRLRTQSRERESIPSARQT